MTLRLLIALLLTGTLFSCRPNLPDEVVSAYATLPKELDFNIHVKPILSDKCFACHGPDKAKIQAELQLNMPETAFAELVQSPGKYAIKPGNLNKSQIFHRILSEDPDQVMPTPESNLSLSPYEKAVIIKWIEQGAEYKDHWAFTKPEKYTPPQVNTEDWIKNPIDQFVAHKLEENGLEPSPEAKKELLLRRVSLDLTGLPPTLDEIEAFRSDNSENAYEKQVDRLLASPHYGEKMATDWMDLARFADTHGYSQDRYRDMSPWRDWVIEKFNENMPYDEFITWQLAGDLLPDPNKEQILATAFNRLHPQNMEGGIIPEEFRVEYVLDRVNTAGQAFMALTLGCARCHDHKYDPISQKQYFEMSAFFNNVKEAGQISFDDAMPVPTMLWTDEKKEALLNMLDKQVKETEQKHQEISTQEKEAFDQWLEAGKYKAITQQKSPKGLKAVFNFNRKRLSNRLNPSQKGEMKRVASSEEKPVFTEGFEKEGLLLDGDAWFDSNGIGAFKRSEPFSVSIRVNIPAALSDGVIFHRGVGAALFNFRGYHLALKNNKLELLMAHSLPYNAILEYADPILRDKWVQLTITYDGSSKAAGYKLFVDGKEQKTEVENDNLYKDIYLHNGWGGVQPGLQIGARWRGQGIGGAKVDDIMVFDRELTTLEVNSLYDREEVEKIRSKSSQELSAEDKKLLYAYFLANKSRSYQNSIAELARQRKAYADSIEHVQELMIMQEMPEARPTFLLERGQYDAHGEEVFPGVMENILSFSEELPRTRLGFVQWLTHPEHPLTARVTVNRYWQNYFGRGLVKTAEDFGNQGELPSHPELLDWLAIQFVESGWDVKALQKLIVMSATYRQSSFVSPELLEQDPENVFLARGPKVRLSSEMLRDNALMASGLLSNKIGGPSVKPYQPKGLWRMNSGRYKQDEGEKLYRRSLYTFWKRSVPHPTLATFDQPSRSECIVRRQKTNTPLQALVLLNDPTFVEASKALGELISQEVNPERGIAKVYTKLTGIKIPESELKLLLEVQSKEYEKFKTDPKRKEGWLKTGDYQTSSDLDSDLLAANAVVASIILNSDATISKR